VTDKRYWQYALLIALPVLLCVWGWLSRPFAQTVLTQTLSTRTLNAAQVTNLRIASRYLDSRILQPGESMSFNRWVGPRSMARGYRMAPSYLGSDSPATVGGGICLLSSALYQLALQSGFEIQQRVPHLRTIHSVPPGLDATVWYGGADLRFRNRYREPLQLHAQVKDGNLSLSLRGKHPLPPQAVARLVNRRGENALLVEVFRDRQTISRDLYRLSP
jgi:vancomycin resistance protein VanW